MLKPIRAGKEASPTGRTGVDRRCAVGAGGSGLACHVSAQLEGTCAPLLHNDMAPGGLSEASDSQDSGRPSGCL